MKHAQMNTNKCKLSKKKTTEFIFLAEKLKLKRLEGTFAARFAVRYRSTLK